MKSRQTLSCILMLIVSVQLIIATLEAADVSQAGATASAETEKVIRKIKVPGKRKIVRSIRVLEPNNGELAQPASQPQATASNNVDVSPAINIKMPTLPEPQPATSEPPQPQIQPIVNGNINSGGPPNLVESGLDNHLPHDLKSPNTVIRQVPYKPRKREIKIVQEPPPTLVYALEGSGDDPTEPVVLETPGLPGVPITVTKPDEPIESNNPIETILVRNIQQPTESNEVETITVRVPTENLNPAPSSPGSHPKVASAPTLDIVPYNGIAEPTKKNYIVPINYQFPQTPNQMLPTPQMAPNHHALNNLVAGLTYSPTNTLADIGYNKSVNMSNMGNQNHTVINAPTSSPTHILNMPAPIPEKAAENLETVAVPKPKKKVARKGRGKVTVRSTAPTSPASPQVVGSPIFIQYNQMPQQPLASQSPPVFVSSPDPTIRSYPGAPFIPYSMVPIHYGNPPMVSSSCLMPTADQGSLKSMLLNNNDHCNYWPRTDMRTSPFVNYPYAPIPYLPFPNEYANEFKPNQMPFPYMVTRWVAPMIAPPIQYAFPYAPYPFQVPVPVPMRPQEKIESPIVEEVNHDGSDKDLKEDLHEDSDGIGKFKNVNLDGTKPEQEIQYIERERVVPIDYEEHEDGVREILDKGSGQHPIEWENTKIVPEAMGLTETIREPEISEHLTKLTEEVQMPRFKTIKERVPITSTITGETS